MPVAYDCLGRELLEWVASKYPRVSDQVYGVVKAARLLVEAWRVLEGNDRVKNMVVEELRASGRDDLARVVEAFLSR